MNGADAVYGGGCLALPGAGSGSGASNAHYEITRSAARSSIAVDERVNVVESPQHVYSERYRSDATPFQ